MTANADISPSDGERRHDPLCPISSGPCCPWMGDCDCQCECDWIASVREDMALRYLVTDREQQEREDAAYVKGQRDEREACIADVYRTCGHTKYEGCAPCAHDDAVAAIRAR